MQKQPRKLKLDKHTVQTLVPAALANVVGGTASMTTANSWKNTYDVRCQPF